MAHTEKKPNRKCWCPCNCGCEEPNEELMPSGLCWDCRNGAHEVVPEGVHPGVEELLPLYQSIVERYAKVLQRRNKAAKTKT